MKKVYITLLISGVTVLSILQSCKGKEEVGKREGEEVLLEVYCAGPEFFTTKDHFRANAIGESLDQMTAKKKAISNARAQLAGDIKNTMKIVGDNFQSSTEFNNKEELTETFNELARTVVDQTLQGLKVICEKQTKTAEGKYKTYLAIELSATEILNKYNERLSDNEKLKADYNYEKFKKTFESEMNKLSVTGGL